MGLFGKLFDKKNCAICGGDIGLLGNRKLEDGNLCKNCASRLSPWFSERRHSTVQEIEEQLAYREANYERVRYFRPTRQFGENGCLFMDDNMQAFTVGRSNSLTSGNPDIVDYSAYVSIKPEIVEHRWEDHHGPEDKGRPPRFVYDYDFYITVYVNHPYFDDMRFQLNTFSVKQQDWHECMRFVRMTEDCVEAMCGERPDLLYRIRPFEPEPIPIPVPMQNVHAAPAHSAPRPTPRPEPMAPQGRPQPAPQSRPQPAPQAAPQSRPQPAPQSRPQPAPQGRPQPAPQNHPQAAPQSHPQAAPQSHPQAAPQSRPQAAPQSRPQTAPQSRPQAAPQSHPQAAPQSRPQAAPQNHPQAAPQSRPQAAPQSRPQAAPQSRPQTAPQSRPQAAPQSRPQAAPQNRPTNNGGPSGAGRQNPSDRPGPHGNGPMGRR